jgi:hypothetical protein
MRGMGMRRRDVTILSGSARFPRLESLCPACRRTRTIFFRTPAIEKSPDAITTRSDQNARKRRAAGDAPVMLDCGNTAQLAYAE